MYRPRLHILPFSLHFSHDYRGAGYTQVKGIKELLNEAQEVIAPAGERTYDLGGNETMTVKFPHKSFHGVAACFRMMSAGWTSEEMRTLNNDTHGNNSTVSHELVMRYAMGRNINPYHLGVESLEENKARNSDTLFFSRLAKWDDGQTMVYANARSSIQQLLAAGVDVTAYTSETAAAEDFMQVFSISKSEEARGWVRTAVSAAVGHREALVAAQQLVCGVTHAASTYPHDRFSHLCRLYDGDINEDLFTASDDRSERLIAKRILELQKRLAVPLTSPMGKKAKNV